MKIYKPHQKIAVIGAGPAGIFAAVELQEAGYQDVSIYGKFEEAQCRTKHIDGAVADVGTCYVHSGYFNSIKKFVKRYDIHIKYLGSDAKTVNSSNINQAIQPSKRERFFTYLAILYFLLHSIIWKFLKYTRLGSWFYGVSFEKYLKNVGLGKLAKSFVFGPGGVAQGYGFLNNVNAYRLFRWFRPSIFLTPIMNKRKKGTGIIVEGYGTLFHRAYQTISKRNDLHIREVIREGKKIKLIDENGSEVLYDIAIIACPFKHISSPISKIVNKDRIQSTPLFSYLWTTDIAPNFEDRIYILDYINENKTNALTTYRTYGKTNSGKHLLWGVGYASDGIDREILKQKIENQINKELNLNVDTCAFFEIFDYNVRFSITGIREGLHLKVRNAQGKDNIWYSGGMLSHWDVDSIYEFDKSLVNRLILQNNYSIANAVNYYFQKVRDFIVNI